MIQEVHSSDMSAECPRSVQLRHEGKIIGEMTTALYRGNVWHEAASSLHAIGIADGISSHVSLAHAKVFATADKENRPFTPAVVKNAGEVREEIEELLAEYADRIPPYLSAMTLIGTEIPIRLTLDIDGVPQDFASHLDLLFRAPRGLHVYDWKTGEDQPGYDFLRRSPQMGLYPLAVAEGEVLIDGEWVSLMEWPSMTWVHVNALKVYKKATTNGAGESFKKGDKRTLDKILMDTGITATGRNAIIAELSDRVRMFRAGLYPTNPGEQRCRLCESRTFCPVF